MLLLTKRVRSRPTWKLVIFLPTAPQSETEREREETNKRTYTAQPGIFNGGKHAKKKECQVGYPSAC